MFKLPRFQRRSYWAAAVLMALVLALYHLDWQKSPEESKDQTSKKHAIASRGRDASTVDKTVKRKANSELLQVKATGDEVERWLSLRGRSTRNLLTAALSCCTIFSGNVEKRKALILEALAQSPDDPDALSLALTYNVVNDAPEAAARLRVSDPDNAMVALLQMKLELDRMNKDKALQYLKETVALDKYTTPFHKYRTDCKEMLIECGRSELEAKVFAAFVLEDSFSLQTVISLGRLSRTGGAEAAAYALAAMDKLLKEESLSAKVLIAAYGEQIKVMESFKDKPSELQPYLSLPFNDYRADIDSATRQHSAVFKFVAHQCHYMDHLSPDELSRIATRVLEMGQIAAISKSFPEITK